MVLAPRRIRNLPAALPAKDGDILPISQMDENGVASTRGMTHLQFQTNLIDAVAEARQDLVDGFTEANTQINQAIADLQGHQTWIDKAINQIEDMDASLQSAIESLEGKVDHPVQWTEIESKPDTFSPAPHNQDIATINGLQAALDAASASPVQPTWSTLGGKPSSFPPTLPISWANISDKPESFPASVSWDSVTGKPTTFPPAFHQTAWADITGKPATYAPSAHTHVKADITDFAHMHPQSEVTNLVSDLAGKMPAVLPLANPVSVTPAFGTAYQATVPTKPSFISAMIDTAYTVTVASTLQDTVELRIGPNQAQVAAGTGGFVAATFRASLTGIALVIGMALGQRNQLTAMLPAGWYYSLRRVQGTTATVTSATDQAIG